MQRHALDEGVPVPIVRCDACRQEYLRQKQEAQREYVSANFESPGDTMNGGTSVAVLVSGRVTRTFADRGFGFIESEDGRNYFFHLTDLQPGLEFEDVQEGLDLEFEVKKEPGGDGRAGAAQNVRRRTG
ncbi:MAG: cold shock domain-containing protein [Dehalococcoidales bacterium]|nr:cold shock domain-containing protein [Dehalococcoidales bacterium]